MAVDFLLLDGTIVSMDRHHPFYKSGGVAIDQGRIVAVGPTEEIKTRYSADQIINCKNKLLVPGLINCHVHLEHSIGRGFFSDLDLDEWERRLGKLRSFLSPTNAPTVAALSFLEMIKTGTSCFVDCGTYPGVQEQIAETAVKSGLRGILSRRTVDLHDSLFSAALPNYLREDTETAIDAAKRFVERYNGIGDGRIQAWFNLMVLTDCSDKLCISISELAKEYGVGLTTHAAWHKSEVEACLQRFGVRPIERLDKLGVLGPHVLAAHMGLLENHEVQLVDKYDVRVCHCPSATLHSGYGCAFYGHFPEMRELGVALSLGTDGASSSNFLDMVREMYLLSTLHKEAKQSSTVFPAADSLSIATLGGARALGSMESLGSISPGKKADIAVFDLTRITFIPASERTIVNNLVYSATGESCSSLIVDGKALMLNNEVLTLSETEILEKSQAYGESLAADLT